ncbi:MAG: T9SS type A sorting domain-containing protein, partial [Flavobacteriales bacterium]|nr:T9SS type A sorting domain-containing protein [Flavobacteriales bacterium]
TQPTAVVATFNASQTPFTASASGGTPPYTYEWLYFGNYQSSGTTFSPTESGEYTLVVTDANDCEGRKLNTYNTVDVSEFEDLEVLIYPNPVGDYFNIEIKSETNSEDFTFKLLDARGRVLSQDLFKKSIQVDRKNISPGVYFIHLNSESNFIQRKIIFSEKK